MEEKGFFGRRGRMTPHDRECTSKLLLLHRDVDRSSAKSLGVGRLQGNLSSPRYLEAFPSPGHHEPVKFTVPRLERLHAYIDLQFVPPPADDHAAQRRHVAEVPAPCQSDVVFAHHAIVGRIEIQPAERWAVDRHPGM